MPEVKMSDLEWLNVFSLFERAADEATPNAPGVVQVNVPVTFAGSEAFRNFVLSFPFELPSAFAYGSWSFSNPDLAISTFTESPKPGNLTITGRNLSSSALTVDFILKMALGES